MSITKEELIIVLETYGRCPVAPDAHTQPDIFVTINRKDGNISVPFWDACILAAREIKEAGQDSAGPMINYPEDRPRDSDGVWYFCECWGDYYAVLQYAADDWSGSWRDARGVGHNVNRYAEIRA